MWALSLRTRAQAKRREEQLKYDEERVKAQRAQSALRRRPDSEGTDGGDQFDENEDEWDGRPAQVGFAKRPQTAGGALALRSGLDSPGGVPEGLRSTSAYGGPPQMAASASMPARGRTDGGFLSPQGHRTSNSGVLSLDTRQQPSRSMMMMGNGGMMMGGMSPAQLAAMQQSQMMMMQKAQQQMMQNNRQNQLRKL